MHRRIALRAFGAFLIALEAKHSLLEEAIEAKAQTPASAAIHPQPATPFAPASASAALETSEAVAPATSACNPYRVGEGW